MALFKKKQEKEEIVQPSSPDEGAPEHPESLPESGRENDLTPEKIQELRQTIDQAEVEPDVHAKAQVHAQDLKALDDEKKIKKLLELAQTKGVVYAVTVAQKMNDPYILDKLHDMLAKGGYYKNFIQ